MLLFHKGRVTLDLKTPGRIEFIYSTLRMVSVPSEVLYRCKMAAIVVQLMNSTLPNLSRVSFEGNHVGMSPEVT